MAKKKFAIPQDDDGKDCDGWDKEDLREVGLITFLEKTYDLSYVIEMCTRDSKGRHDKGAGTTAKSMVKYLKKLQAELGLITSRIEKKIS